MKDFIILLPLILLVLSTVVVNIVFIVNRKKATVKNSNLTSLNIRVTPNIINKNMDIPDIQNKIEYNIVTDYLPFGNYHKTDLSIPIVGSVRLFEGLFMDNIEYEEYRKIIMDKCVFPVIEGA